MPRPLAIAAEAGRAPALPPGPGLESPGVSGGTDISFLSGLRVPCAIILALFLGLLVLIGSCIVSNWT